MARAPAKHGRDQALDFQGFLNDLQDWELSLKDKDKKIRPDKESPSSMKGYPSVDKKSGINLSGSAKSLGGGFSTEESAPDAASEKELGNEFFKQKKFNEAIDCYSRSIAFSPTAVAYANRAMAYLKIRRFKEAEDDCTEALNLDDRYIKAYSRRAMARKELAKYKESLEDAEFALRLEPQNEEVKKQYSDAKSLYEKEILKKATGALRSSIQGPQKSGKSEKGCHSSSVSNQRTEAAAVQDHSKEHNGPVSLKPSIHIEEIKSKSNKARIEDDSKKTFKDVNGSVVEKSKGHERSGKQELKVSVQDLATRAASRAMSEAAKNITPLNSAYQFEVSWRGFSGDRSLQARLLKVTSPGSLPQIFKNALSAPLLVDIIKCVATFFTEDVDLAVNYLDNLTKVPRFDMIIMCLSSEDKADLLRLWKDVFCSEATPIEHAETLDNLRAKYCLKQ
ncbi:RNA polymerase II-associated protein 3 isoform X1 [Eucalyptus grandis]|uniref:RNA polymerase II-associated protein 3 isoform X1 n=1 Tax=Eucalyptus grandis TaxID=71139 RepID=UPI00192F04BB|nr:RNA polymerase II-associated protein 3 isoform X1 [Eucalyptus grandis]